MSQKVGDIRILDPPKKTPVKVLVEDDCGNVRIINAFKVVFQEVLTRENISLDIYSYEWKENGHFYEDIEGRYLPEVYQLIRL